MDNNEIIKSLLKELVTEEMLRDVIGAVVYDYLDSRFTYSMEEGIRKKIETEIKGRSDVYIQAAVDKVMNGMVRTDDGWGNTKEYGNFDDLVRARINKNLNDGWNVERKVRDAVDARIKKLCEQVRKQHVDNMAEQVLERLAEGEAAHET